MTDDEVEKWILNFFEKHYGEDYIGEMIYDALKGDPYADAFIPIKIEDEDK